MFDQLQKILKQMNRDIINSDEAVLKMQDLFMSMTIPFSQSISDDMDNIIKMHKFIDLAYSKQLITQQEYDLLKSQL